jgi:hypothetical protein
MTQPNQALQPTAGPARENVYDNAGKVIEAHEHKGDFKEP